MDARVQGLWWREMIQAKAAGSIESRRQSRSGAYSSVNGTVIVLTLLSLVLLDVLSPPGPPITPLIGGLVYGLKTALGVFVVVFGLFALFATRLPATFRTSVILYVSVVLLWFFLWILGFRSQNSSNSSVVTYLLNPTYSVWSWLFILLVPIVARWNAFGKLSNAIARVPLWLGSAIMLVPALGVGVLNWNLNASNSSVLMLFLLACRPVNDGQTRFKHFLIALLVCAAMIVAEYRIYSVGAILFAVNLYIPKNRFVLISQIIIIAASPIIFHFIVDSYANVLISRDNPLLFDTRSFLFAELVDDFSSRELITGRGIDGSYFSPYFLYVAKHMATSVGYNNIWRTSSEIGWLNVVLHYGILGVIPLYLALIAPTFVNCKRLQGIIPMQGIYCFLPVMMLLFSGELWNSISASYFCWYAALGMLLTAQPTRRLPAHLQSVPPVGQLDTSRGGLIPA